MVYPINIRSLVFKSYFFQVCYDKLNFFTAVRKNDCLFIKGLLKKILIMLAVADIAGIDADDIPAAVLFRKIPLLGIVYEAFDMQPNLSFPLFCDGCRAFSFCSGIQPILCQRNIS